MPMPLGAIPGKQAISPIVTAAAHALRLAGSGSAHQINEVAIRAAISDSLVGNEPYSVE